MSMCVRARECVCSMSVCVCVEEETETYICLARQLKSAHEKMGLKGIHGFLGLSLHREFSLI